MTPSPRDLFDRSIADLLALPDADLRALLTERLTAGNHPALLLELAIAPVQLHRTAAAAL